MMIGNRLAAIKANALKMPMHYKNWDAERVRNNDYISQAACLLPYLQSLGHGTLKFTQLVTEVTCQRHVIEDLAGNEGSDTHCVGLGVTCNVHTRSS